MDNKTCVKLLLLPMLFSGLVTHFVYGASSHQLPSSFPRCKRTDPNLSDCLLKAVQTAIPQLKGGIPSLGVVSLDPLQVLGIEIAQGQGPISISQKFTNITVTGLGDAKVLKANPDLNNYKMNYDGIIQTNIMEADYELSGRILLLPVTGKGRCKLIFTNIQAAINIIGKGTVKKGNTYFDITDFKLDINRVDNLHVQFDNLFNGDKTLGESMNNLMNMNWKDLWNELKPAFDQSFGAVFKHYSKSIFDKVPFNEIFID